MTFVVAAALLVAFAFQATLRWMREDLANEWTRALASARARSL